MNVPEPDNLDRWRADLLKARDYTLNALRGRYWSRYHRLEAIGDPRAAEFWHQRAIDVSVVIGERANLFASLENDIGEEPGP